MVGCRRLKGTKALCCVENVGEIIRPTYLLGLMSHLLLSLYPHLNVVDTYAGWKRWGGCRLDTEGFFLLLCYVIFINACH